MSRYFSSSLFQDVCIHTYHTQSFTECTSRSVWFYLSSFFWLPNFQCHVSLLLSYFISPTNVTPTTLIESVSFNVGTSETLTFPIFPFCFTRACVEKKVYHMHLSKLIVSDHLWFKYNFLNGKNLKKLDNPTWRWFFEGSSWNYIFLTHWKYQHCTLTYHDSQGF